MTGRRENRNRIPRALVGFSNALLVTGDQKYVDAWRDDDRRRELARARRRRGRREYPTMYGADGWYGWQREPWSVGALEVWYWSMRPADRARVAADPWVQFLDGKNAGYPEAALQRELESIPTKVAQIRADQTPPDKRLADNMLDSNPAATDALVRLMFGALVPGREGGLLNARLRYFDPVAPPRRRAGGCRRAGLRARRSPHGRHARQPQRDDAAHGDRAGRRLRRASVRVGRVERPNPAAGRPDLTVQLAPGAGAKLTFAMRRYVNQPRSRSRGTGGD